MTATGPQTDAPAVTDQGLRNASSRLLANKHAVIFGAGGDEGSAVAREFATQGAAVFLSGRTLAPVGQVAEEISNHNGTASAAEVDALDARAVQDYVDRVAREAGSIDVALNVMGSPPGDYGNNTPTLELTVEQFSQPMTTLVPSQFITAQAAARHMIEQRSGSSCSSPRSSPRGSRTPPPSARRSAPWSRC
jgi:3-oxoacyl-[acyl-carrier protein] reductase